MDEQHGKINMPLSIYLVNEVLEVLIGKCLGAPDDLVQVRVHELIDDVDVVIFVFVGRFLNIPDCDDVLMPKMSEQFNLPQRPPRVRKILEGVSDLLDCHLLPSHQILCTANNPIGTLANGLDRLVLIINNELAAPNDVGCLAGKVAFLLHRQIAARAA